VIKKIMESKFSDRSFEVLSIKQASIAIRPLVTVIALCHNHEQYVVETLESIVSQNYNNLEVIIVENHCSDNSKAIIENWLKDKGSRYKLISNEHINNVSKNINLALEFASGDYISLVSCDDLYSPDKISKQVDLLENNRFIDLVCSNFNRIDKNGNHIDVYFKSDFVFPDDLFSAVLGKYSTYYIVIHPATILYRKSVIDEVNGFDESYMQEDLAMFLKLSSLGYKVYYQPEPLIHYRILPTSLSKNPIFYPKIQLEAIALYKQYLEMPQHLTKAQILSLIEGIYIRAFALARHYIGDNDRYQALASLDLILKVIGDDDKVNISPKVANDYLYIKLTIYRIFGLNDAEGAKLFFEIMRNRYSTLRYKITAIVHLVRIVVNNFFRLTSSELGSNIK